MKTPSLTRLLKHPATIRGRVGASSTIDDLFDVTISPVDSLDPSLALGFQLSAPFQLKQAFAYTDQEIIGGMNLKAGNKEYPIKEVASYPDDGGFTLYHLILEDTSLL